MGGRRKIRAKREEIFFTPPRRGVITSPQRGVISYRYNSPNGVSFLNCTGVVVYMPPQRGVWTLQCIYIYIYIHIIARRRRNFFYSLCHNSTRIFTENLNEIEKQDR